MSNHRILLNVAAAATVVAVSAAWLANPARGDASPDETETPLAEPKVAAPTLAEPPLEFHDSVEPIGEVIGENPDVFTGSVISPDAHYLEVFVKEGSMEEARRLLVAEGVRDDVYVLTPRQHSLKDLQEQAEDAFVDAQGLPIQAIGVDASGDGIAVTVQASAEEAGSPQAQADLVARVREALLDHDVTDVEVATGPIINLNR